MSISAMIRDVFGHFQNLNLLALLHDLQQDRTSRQAWTSGGLLCPVAHGLPSGQQAQRLSMLGQIAELGQGCDLAARLIGADPAAVLRFVRSWDAEELSRRWLEQQLHQLWQERLVDAESVQELLQKGESSDEDEWPSSRSDSEADAVAETFAQSFRRLGTEDIGQRRTFEGRP